jgi:hypothetical protein
MNIARCVLLLPLTMALVIAGCATSEVTSQEQMASGPLPRPNTIWVYSFAGTPSDVPAESILTEQLSSFGTPSPDQTAAGRQAGAEIASDLAAEISAMGINAVAAGPGSQPQINDIVLHGYIVSLNAGSEEKRAIIGLGDGTSQLQVAVEGFQMTSRGLRELGAGSTESTGAKTPGVGVGLIGSLVTHNPLGLIVTAGTQLDQEYTGKGGLSGRAAQTAKEIAGVLKTKFQMQGWIP